MDPPRREERESPMFGLSRPLLIVWIGLASVFGGLAPADADSSIRVLVNDQPITSYDISQRARLMTLAGEKGGEKAATDQLIDEAIEMQDAKRLGLAIPDAQVDAAFASIAQNLKLSPDKFEKALAAQNVEAATLKKRLRAQIIWHQLIKARVAHDAAVKPSDVTAALFAEGSPDTITTKELTLQQILFVVPKGSSTGYVVQRRREAESYRLRFTGCDHSIEEAKSLTDVTVRNIGRRDTSQLTGPRGEEVKKLAAGKTSSPEQTDLGIEVVAVCSIREIQSNAAARSEIEAKLAGEQSTGIGKDYLKQLHDKAVIEYR
jgi:peptidyl-prolyl cis-trans isomerase SurA